MQTGTKISAAAHLGLIGLAVFGSAFADAPPPLEMPNVSVISAQDYAALTQPQAPAVAEAPETIAEPDPAPQVEEPTPPEPVAEPEPQPEPEPEVVEPTPQPQPEPPEVAEQPPEPPTPEPPAPEVSVAPEPAPVTPEPPKIERVAPEPVAPPPPDVKPAEEATAAVVPEKGPAEPQEPKEEAAPEAATDRITPEPKVETSLAPTTSKRPPAARPKPPERVVETAQPKPDPKPEAKPEPEPADTSAAVNDALAQALAGGTQEAAPAPAGPPLSEGEKDALRVQVSRCWNVGSLSSAAMNTTVVVALNVAQDGKPDGGSIRMLSSSGGDDIAARQAFEAARRAILRCGGSGFDLPAEKYAHWREIEMTFNPERMRIK